MPDEMTEKEIKAERQTTAEMEAEAGAVVETAPEAPAPEIEQPEVEAPPEPLSIQEQRLAKLDEISNNFRAGEIEEASEPEPEPEPEKEVEQEAAEAAPESPLEFIDGKYMATQIIDGVEQKVEYDKIVADAQKANTATKRFQEAAQMKKEAELALQSQRPPDQGVDQTAPPNGEQQGITTDTLNKAVLDGDEQASQQVVDRLNTEAPTIDEVVDATLFETERRKALDSVVNANEINKAIADNPEELEVAGDFSQMLLEREPDLSPAENIEKAFKLARVSLGKPEPETAQAEQKTTQVDESLSERQAAKVSHTKGNLAASSKRASVGKDQPVYSHKSVIAEMREQRSAKFG